jgi:hypothetical protein
MALKVLYFTLEDCDFKVEGEIGLEENDRVGGGALNPYPYCLTSKYLSYATG